MRMELKKTNLVLVIAFCLCAFSCDKARNDLREGNKQYDKSQFDAAAKAYRAALSEDSLYAKAQYNLASASYRQKTPTSLSTAAGYYDSFLHSSEAKDTLAQSSAHYNIGNTFFQISNTDSVKQSPLRVEYLAKAAENYKQSLRLNPKDSNAKYNLALVNYLLNKEKEQNNNQNQQQQQQQSAGGESKPADDSKQKPKNQNQSSTPEDEKGKEDKRNQDPSDAQTSKKKNKETERMLEALKNNEKNTLGKIKRTEKESAQKKRVEKDW